jgi:hypothetical protein
MMRLNSTMKIKNDTNWTTIVALILINAIFSTTCMGIALSLQRDD